MKEKVSAEQLKEYVLFQFKCLENILRISHNDKLAMVIEYIAYDYRSGNTDCEPPADLADKIFKTKN